MIEETAGAGVRMSICTALNLSPRSSERRVGGVLW